MTNTPDLYPFPKMYLWARPDLTIEVTDVGFQRNGVSGEGFYVVAFNNPECGRLTGIVFDAPGHCAVIPCTLDSIILTAEHYRGDRFEPSLRQAVKDYEAYRTTDLQWSYRQMEALGKAKEREFEK